MVAGHRALRGILLGLNTETFDVIKFSKGQYFVSAHVIQRNNAFRWELIIVYGPADHTRSRDFLSELHDKIVSVSHPLVVGGDFNLIRSRNDKSNLVVSNSWLVEMFMTGWRSWSSSNFTGVGARFTWTNNQDDPVRSVLDRGFVTCDWEAQFPGCSLSAEMWLGSDHCPLILNSREAPRRVVR